MYLFLNKLEWTSPIMYALGVYASCWIEIRTYVHACQAGSRIDGFSLGLGLAVQCLYHTYKSFRGNWVSENLCTLECIAMWLDVPYLVVHWVRSSLSRSFNRKWQMQPLQCQKKKHCMWNDQACISNSNSLSSLVSVLSYISYQYSLTLLSLLSTSIISWIGTFPLFLSY